LFIASGFILRARRIIGRTQDQCEVRSGSLGCDVTVAEAALVARIFT
jgi:hypothetical protein